MRPWDVDLELCCDSHFGMNKVWKQKQVNYFDIEHLDLTVIILLLKHA